MADNQGHGSNQSDFKMIETKGPGMADTGYKDLLEPFVRSSNGITERTQRIFKSHF